MADGGFDRVQLSRTAKTSKHCVS